MGLRIGLGIIILVLIAGVITFNRAGSAIRTAAVEYGPEYLGVDVALDDADLSPFSGRVQFSGLALGQPKGYGDGPMAALSRFDMILRPMTLLSDHIIIDEMIIEQPLLDARLIDGKSNFKALSDQLNALAAQGDTADTSSETPITLTIHSLKVKAAEMAVSSDGTIKLNEKLKLANFELTELGTDEKGMAPAEIARHVMGVLEPQVAKALIDAGLKNKATELAKGELDKIGEKLDNALGERTRQTIEDAAKSLFGKKKKKDDTDNN